MATTITFALAAALLASIAMAQTVNFDSFTTGAPPPGWTTEMKVATNAWHTLRVDFQGTHDTVTLDGKKAIEWDDATLKDAGKAGVWTKADSVILFDDFSYGPKQATPLTQSSDKAFTLGV